MEQLALFPKAKPARARPVEPIKRSAFIEGDYRWTLRRAWGAGPPIAWVMLNPSRGDSERDDPTLWDIMCRSLSWGYGSLVVVNVYPFRSPSPQHLAEWRRTMDTHVFHLNAKRAAEVLKTCDMRIMAWGAHAQQHDVEWFCDVVRWDMIDGDPDSEGPEIKFHCLGLTASGAPIHPLARGKHRIPHDRKPMIFDLPDTSGWGCS